MALPTTRDILVANLMAQRVLMRKNFIELKEKTKYFETKPDLATRQCSMVTIENISSVLPQLIGGSADLAGSNNTKTNNHQIIKPNIETVVSVFSSSDIIAT